jgi:hypothetical protein
LLGGHCHPHNDGVYFTISLSGYLGGSTPPVSLDAVALYAELTEA